MRKILFFIIFLNLPAALALDFKNIQALTMKAAVTENSKFATHEVSLSIVMFRDTGWSLELIQKHMNRVAQIYEQCHMRLAPLKVLLVDAPQGQENIEPWSEEDARLAEIPLPLSKPILYFVHSSKHMMGWAGAPFWIEYLKLNGLKNADSLTDTIWITSGINAASYTSKMNSSYNTVAHEIAHILGNAEHLVAGGQNLLSATSDLASDTITAQQCQQFKKHSSVRKL